jgi:hypothetical protein
MTDPNIICPGQKELMPGDSPFYLRATFMVYWDNAMPSLEPVYLHNRPPVLTHSGITELQDEIVKLLASNVGGNPERAIYAGYSGIEMTDQEVKDAGWRVISGQPRQPNHFGGDLA